MARRVAESGSRRGRLAVRLATVVARLAPALLVVPSAAVAADGEASEAGALAGASPEAAQLVARAERAASEGHVKDAWALFGEAWRLAPRSPVPPRGICRLSLALGLGTHEQRAAARSACQNAFMLGGSPEDMHNRSAALVRGAVRPSMEEVVDASFAADGALRQGPTEPWAFGARADVALRLGDRALLDDALADLRRLAPAHAETARVAALAAARASLAIVLGRVVLLLALAGTAAHAFFSARRRRHAALVVAVAAIVLGASSAARADDSPKFEDPLAFAGWLTDANARAQEATARGDHAAAVREYEAITKAVPENAFGFARLCDSLEAAGRAADALVACRTALSRKATTAGDYTHFVQLVLASAPGRRLLPAEQKQVDLAVAALEREPRAALIATRVRCNVAAHEHDRPALESCTAKLVAAAPEDVRTIQFQRALAVETGDSAAARLHEARARAAAGDATLARKGEGAGPVARASVATRITRAGAWAAAALVALFAVAGLAALARRGWSVVRRRAS
jgi:hypothetical protein